MLEVQNNKISLTRGDTAIFTVEITDQGEPYELQDGDVLEMTVRETPSSGDVYIRKTGTTAEIVIEPEDTAKMKFGRYYYDVQLTKAGGIVDTIIPPTLLEIMPEVTYE